MSTASRTCVIFNPQSGTASSPEALAEALAPLGAVTLQPTSAGAHARELALAAIKDGCDLVIAAGGDGTINEVVNGLAQLPGRARLGILPLGTGNDFARSIAMPTELDAAVAALVAGRTEQLDLIKVDSEQVCWFINVSAGGFSGLVDEKLTDELKSTWGPFAYLLAAAGALPELIGYEMTVQFDDEEPQQISAYNVVVANGRFVAGGLPVAPHAILNDGLAEVVIVPVLPATKIGLLAPQLFLGKHINSDALIVRQVRRFTVDSKPGMWFNVDGELVGNEPARFEVVPRALGVIVGPDYQEQPPV